MGLLRLPSVIANTKQAMKLQSLFAGNNHHDHHHRRSRSNVPNGHVAVYIGDVQRRRFLVPVTFLNHPSFRELLRRAEEEFGFDQPPGALTIPCKEEAFIDLTSQLHSSRRSSRK
ncbi:auxin-responsive protein SAUR23-like [Rhodamnia argentea]|uniref:Auxin-responsive protein SAUR23-like n=1 Tax=Rhodamnia argentea TaxID=178133 RepID=A0A8B8N7I3_9MYRT|nr:auxin-responsive protein SAUR23-like [Rhodamnia argentea]